MIAKNCVPHENTYLQRKQQDHLHENTQKKTHRLLTMSLYLEGVDALGTTFDASSLPD